MPKLNLGRVKGDPLTWDDLTDEQKASLKGQKGDIPIVKAGTTTIVKFDQNAKVTSETNGDVTSFNFQIPVGQKPPYYGAYADFPEEGDPDRTYIDDTVDPRLMYTWDTESQKYILTGGAGGADGGSVDIPITLTSAGWTGTTAPYQQTITVPQMREGMTPLFFLASDGDDAQYAFSLITGYSSGYAEITFYAADKPAVNIDLTLKGIPAQEMEYVDNTVVFLVEPSAFAVNETTQRYEATIDVPGMTEGTGGTWDIVRSGADLTVAESKIALSITDVDRQEGSVKITCLEVPAQRYMMSIAGAYPDAEPGTVILAGMQEWFDRVDESSEKHEAAIHNCSGSVKYTKFGNFVGVTGSVIPDGSSVTIASGLPFSQGVFAFGKARDSSNGEWVDIYVHGGSGNLDFKTIPTGTTYGYTFSFCYMI